jgi:D-alanyl-D-alanine carboxypeptidase
LRLPSASLQDRRAWWQLDGLVAVLSGRQGGGNHQQSFKVSGGIKMRNVDIKTQGTKMVITIDLSQAGETSKSGKSKVIASTEGNTSVSGVMVGVNVYKKI